MTKLPEKSLWSDILQIENGEVFNGGVDGSANKQAIALANRTIYLQEAIETHTSKANNPHSVTAAQVGAALANHTHTKAQITDFSLADLAGLAEKVNYTDFTSWGNASIGGRKFPDGFIIQWGVNASSAAGYSFVSFPTTFPTVCTKVVCAITGTHTKRATPFVFVQDVGKFQLTVIGDNDAYIYAKPTL